jgi:hypothetical protein
VDRVIDAAHYCVILLLQVRYDNKTLLELGESPVVSVDEGAVVVAWDFFLAPVLRRRGRKWKVQLMAVPWMIQSLDLLLPRPA